jgi:FAD/FMN-containing dehydrogenase
MSYPAKSQPQALSPELIERLAAIVGASHALTDPDQQLPYIREQRDMYNGRASLVLRPGSTQEVSQILALANAHGIPVVPQAGNTGLVGGQIPMRGEILLSVSRLKQVRAVDPPGFTITVEAGLTLAEVQRAADDANRLFPLSLPSEGTCQIGGNLSTNAGGVNALVYGTARSLVLGLEVVLADGRVWNGLSQLKKDNTGYDLKDLFIGAEGTLGIITAAVLKLFPKPAEKATAFVGLPDLDSALALFTLGQEIAGSSFSAFEVMKHNVLHTIVTHARGARNPFPGAEHPWYALLETSGLKADGAAERLLTDTLMAASERGILTDAVVAGSLGQARDFWYVRESYSEAQKPLGGSVKNDVSVPVHAIPEFIRRADAAMERICPGCRPIPIAHFGDGNIHYNISQPEGMDKAKYLAHWDDMVHAVHEVVLSLNGSISAEHGIGQMKVPELAAVKGPVAMELMRGIKAVFDPKGILNPGKVL